MPSLPPLRWDFCLNCNGTLSQKEIDDDDSFCYYCMEELDYSERRWTAEHMRKQLRKDHDDSPS